MLIKNYQKGTLKETLLFISQFSSLSEDCVGGEEQLFCELCVLCHKHNVKI